VTEATCCIRWPSSSTRTRRRWAFTRISSPQSTPTPGDLSTRVRSAMSRIGDFLVGEDVRGGGAGDPYERGADGRGGPRARPGDRLRARV